MDPNAIEPKIVIEQLMLNYRFFHSFSTNVATTALATQGALFVGFFWCCKHKTFKNLTKIYAFVGILISLLITSMMRHGTNLVNSATKTISVTFPQMQDLVEIHGANSTVMCAVLVFLWIVIFWASLKNPKWFEVS